MWVDIGVYLFMISGTLAGAVQHLFNFNDIAKDLTPKAFDLTTKFINPAAKFWGGDFLASVFLAQAGMAIVYGRHPLVREAYLVLTGLMFSFVGIAWSTRGDLVGNPDRTNVIGMDFGLATLAFVGAFLARRERLQSYKKSKSL